MTATQNEMTALEIQERSSAELGQLEQALNDPQKLTEAAAAAPALLLEYTALRATARKQAVDARRARDIISARLHKQMKSALTTAGIKPTVADIEAEINQNEDYQRACADMDEQEFRSDLLAGAVDALQAACAAANELVNYHAGDR